MRSALPTPLARGCSSGARAARPLVQASSAGCRQLITRSHLHTSTSQVHSSSSSSSSSSSTRFSQQQRACQQTQPQRRQRCSPVCASGGANGGPGSSRSNGNSSNSSIIKDSDGAFLLKLVAASFAGAVLIKYGSLLISLPFEPNAAVALGVVLGTPAAYSLWLLSRGSGGGSE